MTQASREKIQRCASAPSPGTGYGALARISGAASSSSVRAAGFDFFEIHEEKSRGIPDFIREGARAEDAVLAEHDIGAGRGHAGEHVAQRVGAVLLRELQRIDAGAFRLRHLRAFGRAHERMQIEAAEGNAIFRLGSAREVQAHHDHARIPEKQDVVAADQQARGIERAQVLGVVGPAERGKRPERRAEPRIEHVGILREFRAAALRAFRRHTCRAGVAFDDFDARIDRREPFPCNRRNARWECDGPTRAAARCTSREYFRAIAAGWCADYRARLRSCAR